GCRISPGSIRSTGPSRRDARRSVAVLTGHWWVCTWPSCWRWRSSALGSPPAPFEPISALPKRDTSSSQPRLSGANDSMRSIGHLQLAEYAGDVVAHRLGAEDEVAGDLYIALALGEQVKNLALTVGQSRKDLWRRGGLGRREEGDQSGGDRWAKDGLAASHCPERAQEASPAPAGLDTAVLPKGC